MEFSLRHLWLFPFIAATSWFLTLSILLLTWLAKGLPQYPDQSNPYVPFISDIGAFTLKPVFCVGGVQTAVFFTTTICTVHFARYSPRMYSLQDAPYTRTVSALAIFASVVSGLALVLLCVLDTYRYHEKHSILLTVCFMGLGVSACCTSFVYFDQTRKSSRFRRLRLYCMVTTVIVWFEVCLGVAFMWLLYHEWYRVAGILEWIVSYLGVFWLASFIGYVAVSDEGIDVRERDPLLGDIAYLT